MREGAQGGSSMHEFARTKSCGCARALGVAHGCACSLVGHPCTNLHGQSLVDARGCSGWHTSARVDMWVAHARLCTAKSYGCLRLHMEYTIRHTDCIIIWAHYARTQFFKNDMHGLNLGSCTDLARDEHVYARFIPYSMK